MPAMLMRRSPRQTGVALQQHRRAAPTSPNNPADWPRRPRLAVLPLLVDDLLPPELL
jgi:hypothetical protein